MKINKKIFSMLFMVIVLFTCISSNFSVSASSIQRGRDISNEVVTSLVATPNSINDGGNVQVRLEFKENHQRNIQSGDTITVKWTNSGEVFFEGYEKTIPLYVKDQNVGQAVIEKTGATLTFNDKIDKLDDVGGWATFTLQGRNITSGNHEHTGIAYIISGSKRADVNITKPESGTTSVFYYKTGSMYTNDTNHVNWWLLVNPSKVYSEKNVYIQDEIQGGQTLEPDSFEIVVTWYDGYVEKFKGKEAIREFHNKYPNSNISVSENKITVNISQEDSTQKFINIFYKTKITNPKQKEFVNNTKAWFKEYNKPAVNGESFNHSVQNINADAGVNGTVKGELKIIKTLKDKSIPIKDVQFKMRRVDNTVIKDGKKELLLITDDKGIANVKGLPVGKYEVKEISAPEWIAFDPLTAPKLEFTISDQDTEGKLWAVENELKTISIPVEKVWVGQTSERAEIKLFADGVEVDKVILNADNNWKHTFENKPEYNSETKQKINYSVSETTISGYESNITGDAKNGFIVTNTELPDLTIGKEVIGELGDKTKVFNFELTLKQADGNPINGKFNYIGSVDDRYKKESIKPSDGEITFIEGKATITLSHGQEITIKDLPYGVTYKVMEKEANENGYLTTYNGNNEVATGELKQDTKVQVVNNKEFVPTTGISTTTEQGTIVGMVIFSIGILMVMIVVLLQLNKGLKR